MNRVVKDEMMCRIGPEKYDEALLKVGCREMIFTGERMKGYIFVNDKGKNTKKDFDYCINKVPSLFKTRYFIWRNIGMHSILYCWN